MEKGPKTGVIYRQRSHQKRIVRRSKNFLKLYQKGVFWGQMPPVKRGSVCLGGQAKDMQKIDWTAFLPHEGPKPLGPSAVSSAWQRVLNR
jgi:hypothetical protein